MVSLFMALAATPALPGEAAVPLIGKLDGCAELKDSRQRLACFDREFAPYRTRNTVPTAITAPAAATPPADMPAQVPAPPAFGEEKLSPKERPKTAEAEQVLHARIAALRQINPDTVLVTLDNGQVWRHEDTRLGAFLREGDAVTLSKGSLGSYRLTRDEGAEKAWIRATRVR
jgi:hypothetical protein